VSFVFFYDTACQGQFQVILHTYIHSYIHTYIHTVHTHFIYTFIHTYIHTYIHIIHINTLIYITYLHTYLHTYTLFTYIRTNIFTYIHTNIHIILHTYIHTYVSCRVSAGCTHRDTQLAEQRTKVLRPGTRGCMYGRVEQLAAQLIDGFQTDLPQYRTCQGDLQLRKHRRHLHVCMYVCMYV